MTCMGNVMDLRLKRVNDACKWDQKKRSKPSRYIKLSVAVAVFPDVQKGSNADGLVEIYSVLYSLNVRFEVSVLIEPCIGQ